MLRVTAGLSRPDNSRRHFASREDSLHDENPERAFNASELPNENEFDKPRVPVASHSRRAQYSRALQGDLFEQEALRPGSAWPGLPEYYVDEPDTRYDIDEPAAKLSKRGSGLV
ncbi:uncharacterized protein N7459_001685 [Penicillium hispanicum]|uniref:uncharacterized protein n=1 Tax=Penicillium hispanicum TaxID=1080232 RepID=UPI00254212DF|nr:uncharacterized protein N7459_001685 [Penicillium hispanicum]KAJ5595477.1 hypothetical protein N7459_001685 [Penicillium hispanicum]